MSKGNNWETDLLKGLFQAVALANVFDNASSSPITDIQISLHSSDPGEGGDQTTNEVAYTSYARVAVVRTSSGWAVSGGNCDNVAAISFPTATGGSVTATHAGVGKDASGAGYLYYSGILTGSLAISSGITPEFAIGDLDITED